MKTQWDDDRVLAAVEPRDPTGHQQEIDAAVGFVVRLYDLGPPDGRLEKRSLMFDSEVAHGSLGMFGDETEAEEFAGRRREATLAGSRAQEMLHHERAEHLHERLLVKMQARDEARAEAKAANKRAKELQEDMDTLAQEVETPSVEVECGPGAHGFTIYASPCLTDGNLGQERRELHGMGQAPPPEAQQTLDPVTTKRRAARKKKHPKRVDQEEYVEDTSGHPIKVGTKVEVHDDEGVCRLGDVSEILAPSNDGQMVQVQLEGGEVLVVLSGECVRVP